MQPYTWNADRETLPDGKRRYRFAVRNRNYLTDAGWQLIDATPRQSGTDFVIDRAPYSLTVPATANGTSLFESTNRYDIHSKRPMPDAPRGIQKRYSTALPVPGIVTAEGIRFTGAWPSLNADRLIVATPNNVKDLVVFLSQPPGTADVQVPFEIDADSLDILESTGHGRPPVELPPQANPKAIVHGLSFASGPFRGVKVKQPRVWDSAGNSAPITFVGRVQGTRFIGHKLIPRSFLSRAVYPVFADATFTFYPDPHTESTSVDGVVGRVEVADTWADIRDGAGNSAADTVSNGTVQIFWTEGAWYSFQRIIVLFDVDLDAEAIVEAASFSAYGLDVFDAFSDSVSFTSSSPASNTALVSADYSQLGTGLYSDTEIALSAWSASGYNTFPLNAGGLAAIPIGGGIFSGGLRIKSDIDNVEPTPSEAVAGASMWMADRANTTQDPKLVVVTAGGATGSGCLLASMRNRLVLTA